MPNIAYDPAPLTDVFRKVYADAYASGIHVAAQSAGRSIATQAGGVAQYASSIDWTKWKPGDPEAALQVANGGLTDLLNAAGQTIDGIYGTTETRLGNIIGDGLAAGDSTSSIAAAMSDLINNPDRAQMIADTETNRAQTAAQAEQLDALGFSQFEWMAYDGACEECQGQEDSNPHDIGDEMPPGHPSCRCSIVGAGDIASEDTTTDDTAGPAIGGGEDVATEASSAEEPAPSPESDQAMAVYETKAAARRDLDSIRADITEQVRQTSNLALDNLEAFDGVLSTPVRGDSNWDWFYNLGKGEQDRIRRNWVDPVKGLGPDQLTKIVADKGLVSDGYVDTGMRFFLDNSRTYDAARPILSQGRMVTGNQMNAYGDFNFDSLAPNSAYKVTEMFGSKADALDHLLGLRQEDQTLEDAHRIINELRAVPGMDKPAYEMTQEEYFTTLYDTWLEFQRVEQLYVNSTDEFGPILSAEDRQIEERFYALYPKSIEAMSNMDMDNAYDAIMQVAKQAGVI